MVAGTRLSWHKEVQSVLTFEEVRWTTADGREVLGGVSGIVVGGTVTAILGESGAGKTTLLQTLGGQARRCSATWHHASPSPSRSSWGTPFNLTPPWR